MAEALMQTNLALPGRRQGKVRDIYQTTLRDGTDALVIIATDRISAFDVVMPNGVPGKGIVLTEISRFWFEMIKRELGNRLNHHLISTDPGDIPSISDEEAQMMNGRVMIGHRCRVVPIECVVRGYLAGSGWKEYTQNQTVCGVKLPPGLSQCERLSEPIFTPSTKAEKGHDENISFNQACEIAGRDLMTQLRDLSLSIYKMAHRYALGRGIVLADTKFEFGLPLKIASQNHTNQATHEQQQQLPILIDEVLTPDSSRFWPADQYQPGHDQPSFDKQYVRNFLQDLVDNGRWNKTPPGPVLPDEIVRNTLAKYLDAYRALTDQELNI